MVASFSTVTFGPLHYRNLEKDKIGGLKYHNNNFGKKVNKLEKVMEDIDWWLNNIDPACQSCHSKVGIDIHIDASLTVGALMME